MKHDYKSITEQLTSENALESAAQLQGRVCGLLCAAGQLPSDSTAVSKEIFSTVQSQLAQQFTDEALAFELLLPDDDTPMPDRLVALSHWCQGVLSGLGEGELDAKLLQQEDIAELIADIETISRVSTDVEGHDAFEDECDYVEVVDYLRIAIANLYADSILIPAQKFTP